jgi:hypothetical protein
MVKLHLHFINSCFKGFGEDTFQEYIEKYARKSNNVKSNVLVPNPIYINFDQYRDYAEDKTFISTIPQIGSVETLTAALSGSVNNTEFQEANDACDLLYTNINIQGEDPWSRITKTASITGREIWFDHTKSIMYDDYISNISKDDKFIGKLAGRSATIEKNIYSMIKPSQVFTLRYKMPNINGIVNKIINTDVIKSVEFTESSENVFTGLSHLKNFFKNLMAQADKLKDNIGNVTNLFRNAMGIKNLADLSRYGALNRVVTCFILLLMKIYKKDSALECQQVKLILNYFFQIH